MDCSIRRVLVKFPKERLDKHMNLSHLYYFRTLAKTQHYAQAAAQLYITQPNLSYAMAALEKEIGTCLFEKKGRNVILTKYGEVFLEYVTRALSELEAGQKKIRESTNISTGIIDLAFIYTLGSYFVPNLINRFLSYETNKGISFSLRHNNTDNIIKGLKNEKLDLGFCSYVDNEPDIEFTPVMEQELVLIVPRKHPLATLETVDLKQVAPYPMVTFIKECALRYFIDGLFKQVGILPQIACETEEDSAIASLVANDFGVAVVPQIPLLEHFDVKILPIVSPHYQLHIYLAYAKKKYLTPAVHQFRQFVIDHATLFNGKKQNLPQKATSRRG